MTALRPERETGVDYGDAGQQAFPQGRDGGRAQAQEWTVGSVASAGSAGFDETAVLPPYGQGQGQVQGQYDATAVLPVFEEPGGGGQAPTPTPAPMPMPIPAPVPVPRAGTGRRRRVAPVPESEGPRAAPPASGAGHGRRRAGAPVPERAPQAPAAVGDSETVALGSSAVAEARRRADERTNERTDESIPVPGGRAARRKAARKHGRRGGGSGAGAPGETAAEGSASEESAVPMSRVEARRAARARKPGAAVVVSRVVGEVFITTGVLMLLFVTYQLWWSNIRAHAEAGKATRNLQQEWASGVDPGQFSPGQGFAIIHIPKLDVVAPIAEGVSKSKVLDKGMVGHYGEGSLKTAMPEDKTGNFGLAAHRNTHGEPFRYINKLVPGDEVVVETAEDYFVYKITSSLPVTSPSNTSVLDPIPAGSGFTKPGRYITLTTCTPEFTSKYRLIVWGKMVAETPRSEGKPKVLLSEA
ncbi:sortase family protein [Actinobacteria bacterium OK074]|nr:sortase family protein [Actinobacteria bacterium OK074]